MNWAALLGLLPTLLQAVQVAQSIQNDRKAASGLSVADTINKEAPAVISIFQQVGQTLFPNVPAAQQTTAAATALAPDTVKAIQSALNGRMAAGAVQLAVDGHYGPKTKAAVLAFQQANSLTADEWAGPLTQKALGIA